MTTGNLKNFGKFLWSDQVQTKFLKITSYPIDSIIALKVYYLDINTTETGDIILGNVNSEITANIVSNIITEIECGTLNVNEFFGDFKDYSPYTRIHIYLPYIGTVTLNTQEVMKSQIKLKYRINILTGDCIALITITKKIDDTELNSVLYTFSGNCANEIPVSNANNNAIINARLAQLGSLIPIATDIATKNPKLPVDIAKSAINILQTETSANLEVYRTGQMSCTNGSMAVRIPYLIIERVIPKYPSSYSINNGLTLSKTVKLSALKGFTVVSRILIQNFTGTENEYNELEKLLLQGVVF